ncbi:hypothetical protein QAD02_020626 [Eretmocerus hayati]|uniref:Uncharacterized protein n=1 Tax=Eretmocerus hayati TaxID=131215 RepID=A0ACC2PN03_9HYME|nr:hypothetical protein QAD02_020626 [Eretmocerus hayati]
MFVDELFGCQGLDLRIAANKMLTVNNRQKTQSFTETVVPSQLSTTATVIDKQQYTLTANENLAEQPSPKKLVLTRQEDSLKKFKHSRIQGKGNCIAVKVEKNQEGFQDSFKESLTFPEEYRPKEEKLKLQKGGKNKRHPVAISNEWNEEYEK